MEGKLKSWEEIGSSPKEVEGRLNDLNNRLCTAEITASDARIEARRAEGRESEMKEKVIEYESQLKRLRHQNEQLSRAARINESKACSALQERESLLETLKFYENNLGMKTPPRLEPKGSKEKEQDWEKTADELQKSIEKKDKEIQTLCHDIDWYGAVQEREGFWTSILISSTCVCVCMQWP